MRDPLKFKKSCELLVATSNKPLSVVAVCVNDPNGSPLGPAWYIDKQTPRIEANDTITVTGSRLTLDGRPSIVAADITRGNELLKLRNDNGTPVWPLRNERR